MVCYQRFNGLLSEVPLSEVPLSEVLLRIVPFLPVIRTEGPFLSWRSGGIICVLHSFQYIGHEIHVNVNSLTLEILGKKRYARY